MTAGLIFDLASLGLSAVMIGVAVWIFRAESQRVAKSQEAVGRRTTKEVLR